jgi:archaetidylinositol phosphate synthase
VHVWRDRLARWFTPLARRCPLSPNAITILALLLNLGAASAFYFGSRRPAFFLVGMALLVFGGLADAFDGVVARVQGKTSRYGDFLDHFADRVSDLAVVSGWMLGNAVRPEVVVLGLLAVMLNGYAGTQVEATYHERNYDSVGRGEFVLGLVVYPIVSFVLADNGWAGSRGFGLTTAEWLTLLLVVMAALGIAQRIALAARLERSR